MKNYLNSIHEAFQNTLDYFTQHGRGIEWATVALKFHLAYVLIQPGATLSLKTYVNLKHVGFTDEIVATILVIAGFHHACALVANGSWRRSPIWRGYCCFAGMLIFGVMWFLVQSSPIITPVMSPSFLMFAVMVELIGCRQAGNDRKCLMQN